MTRKYQRVTCKLCNSRGSFRFKGQVTITGKTHTICFVCVNAVKEIRLPDRLAWRRADTVLGSQDRERRARKVRFSFGGSLPTQRSARVGYSPDQLVAIPVACLP